MQKIEQKSSKNYKKRHLIVILSVVMVLLASVSIITPFLFTYNKNADATTTRADATIGNLYNVDGTLNKVNAGKLLSKLKYSTNMGDSSGITAPNIATRTGASGSFVFEMGYFVDKDGNMDTGKPLTWQAVYLRNGYLTIWLNNSYTTGYFNCEATGSSYSIPSWLVGYAGYTYSQYANGLYYGSLIRDVTKGIASKLASKHVAWNAYIRSPMEMEAESNTSWQSSQSATFYTTNSTSYISKNNSMKNGTTYDITGDKLWIPSHYEINNKSTSSTSSTNGLWGLTSTSELKDNSTMAYDGTTITSGYSWTRSYESSWTACVIVNMAGSCYSGVNVYQYNSKAFGYRPACHLWLDYLATDIGYDTTYSVTASVNSGSSSKMSLDKTSGSYISVNGEGTPLTFKYTSNTNYTVNKITINGTAITIGQAKQADYLFGVGTEYKCFRSGREVYVIVTRLWQNLTIIGYADYDFVVTPACSDLTIENANCSTNGSTMDARVVVKYNWSKNIRFKLDGSAWTNLSGESGQGTISGVTYVFNADFTYKFVMIEFSGLSVATHSMEVDYYTAPVIDTASSVSVSVSGGSATINKKSDSDGNVQVVVTPASNLYVYSMTIEDLTYNIEYYKAEVYGAGYATTLQYVAKSQNNSFVILAENVYGDFSINLLLSSTIPTLKNPPSSSGSKITGSVVTAGIGGEARIVGNDIVTAEETDTVSYIAVAYSGYKFVKWVDIADEDTALGDKPNLVLNKEDAEGKIIKAVFSPITSENTNSDINDNTSGVI